MPGLLQIEAWPHHLADRSVVVVGQCLDLTLGPGGGGMHHTGIVAHERQLATVMATFLKCGTRTQDQPGTAQDWEWRVFGTGLHSV